MPGPLAGRRALTGLALFLLASGACLKRVERVLVEPDQAGTLDQHSPYLKVHLRSGGLYVLSQWRLDVAAQRVRGFGQLFDRNRIKLSDGDLVIPLDSVALFETNTVHQSGAGKALTLLSGITAAVTGFCLASPKTCFGSCPTFYAATPAGMQLVAEGFSSSIAPALEATDIDMLYRAVPERGRFALELRNEALETHVVRLANLLVAERPAGGRVFYSADQRFIATGPLSPPDECRAEEGDCRELLAAFDGRERWSPADSTDLGAVETIELAFPSRPGVAAGVVVSSRQTLLTTFLLYQGLAYLGSHAGEWLAQLKPPQAGESGLGLAERLGKIEVQVPDGAEWRTVGVAGETGPLAVDTRLVGLPPDPNPVRRIRLRLTRGLWRIDQVSLAPIQGEETPIRVAPARVLHDGKPDREALAALTAGAPALTTMPGDAYRLEYRLPALRGEPELFLEARGYYLEWMRREWIAEENPLKALAYAIDPAGTLKALAPEYTRLEPGMERSFWGSRFARP